MILNANYVLQEPDYGDAPLPDSLDFILPVNGDRMLGELYLPSGIYEAPHPAVIMCHGIPGTNNFDDLAQCLRRIGCVVIRLYHRGAWGSDGDYTFSHCLEDCLAATDWARTTGVEKYGIDPDAIFLAGHSAGGSTVINAARKRPFIRGVIAYCPLDHTVLHGDETEPLLKQEFKEFATVLHVKDFEELWQDSISHQEEWRFAGSAPYFKDHNLLLIGGTKDPVTPPAVILDPFWKALQTAGTKAIHDYVLLPSNHGMDTDRLVLAKTICGWIGKVMG